ncbi:hypothetical protein HHK36_010228 [Tetracentron sinense]|uniref:Uncharacterized protein n=1 Tax=Tetracentron sinense TaxID=13715 RepID=A0A834ZCE0_TETSI|nr:hypothetical protein HHK36_010228 [Tetracentron sinense]
MQEKEDGAKGKENGAKGKENDAKGKEDEKEDGAKGKENGAKGKENDAKGKEDGAKDKEDVSGLTCSSSRFSFRIPARGSGPLCGGVSAFPKNGNFKEKMGLLFRMDRNYWTSPTRRYEVQQTHRIKSAMDSSFGDMADDSTAIFPRINVSDPYKRLGISREASEDEIQAARNFFINKYAGHKPSVDAIESAHDKIIMQKFYERKNPKINIKKKVREVTQLRVVQAVTSRFQTPSTNFIIKTAITFVILGALTVLFPTEEGPTLQGGGFHLLLDFGNLLDGVSDSTYTSRPKEFGSDDFADNLCASLGFFYLSEVVQILLSLPHLDF